MYMTEREKTNDGHRDEEVTQIDQTESGVIIETSIKRGTGTRDEDYIKGTLKKRSLEEAQAELKEFQEVLHQQSNWARDVQPTMDETVLADLAEEHDMLEKLLIELQKRLGVEQ